MLGDEEGERVVAPPAPARRRCSALDVPILRPVGGSTGTGKSTVATEVAHRLGITRVASTDFIRQTMRAFFSRGVHAVDPLLELRGGHGGRRGVPATRRSSASSSSAAHVLVGVEAAIAARAHRGLVDGARGRAPRARAWCPRTIDGALLVHVVLEIADEDVHRMHFHVRDVATGGIRAMDKYLEQLDDIRRIQTLHRRAAPGARASR